MTRDLRDLRHRASPDNAAPIQSAGRLFMSRVNCLQACYALTESRRESFICLRLVCKKSIAASIRYIKSIEKGGPRGLVFIGHIAVPCDRIGAAVQKLQKGLVIRATVHKVNFRES